MARRKPNKIDERYLEQELASLRLKKLNAHCVRVTTTRIYDPPIIVTDENPRKLKCPDGWFYEDGLLKSEYISKTGKRDEIRMETSCGTSWKEIEEYFKDKW